MVSWLVTKGDQSFQFDGTMRDLEAKMLAEHICHGCKSVIGAVRSHMDGALWQTECGKEWEFRRAG